MTLLLDTHVLLYSAKETDQLSKMASLLLKDRSHQIFYSLASIWEIAILISRNRIGLKLTLVEFEAEIRRALGAVPLPIKSEHLEHIRSLEFHHKNPFDRLIAAQALQEGFSLLSRDTIFDAYGVKRIW